MRVLVGLGNPGVQYEKTRHNAGFWVIDSILKNIKAGKSRSFAGGKLWEVFLNGEKHLLFKPETFMNRSGQAIHELLNYFNISTDQVCIIADDVYIDPGTIRIRKGGGDGGHNGWRSVLEQVKPDQFWRVRVGVGVYEQDPEKRMHQPPLDQYVLEPAPAHDQKRGMEAIDKMTPNLVQWLEQGMLEEATFHI